MRKSLIIVGVIILILLVVIIVIYSFAFKDSDLNYVERGENDSNIINNACLEIGCNARDIFVGSINSDKYYECNCRYAKNINPENIICFANDAEALADGRVKSEC